MQLIHLGLMLFKPPDRHASRGSWVKKEGTAAFLSRAKPLFFMQTLRFSGKSQQPKMRKKIEKNVFVKRKIGIHEDVFKA